MKLIWLTDIHLNFLDLDERQAFYAQIVHAKADGILLTGDIAEAPSIADILQEIANSIQKPIYFVLGNHDYYRGGIAAVQTKIVALTKKEPLLYWLPASPPILLDKHTVLVGQDGWADGRYGDFHSSRVAMNDSLLIADLFQQKILSRDSLLDKMQQLADQDAAQLQASILEAIENHQLRKVIVLTHVPPFKEACQYQGKISNDQWLPFFASQATGDVLMALATQYAAIEFLVLCGHTHGSAHYQALNNLVVHAGHAEYYQPELQDFILQISCEEKI